jgi:hypothetical protein
MKKVLVFILGILMISGVADAQIRFGVKAGANLSGFSTKSSFIDQVKGATNYQFGILFQAKALGLAIQPEVLYSVKGGDFNNSFISGIFSGTDTKFRSQNIEIPVNIQYGLDAGLARVYLQAGPYVSFLTGALINDSADDFEASKDIINTLDFGVGAGVGLEVLGVQLAVKYDWGLAKLGKEQLVLNNNINPFNALQNRNLSISIGYLF